MEDCNVSITVDEGAGGAKYELCDGCGSEDTMHYTHETDHSQVRWKSCNNCGATAVVDLADLESITLTIVDTEGE